LIRRLFPKLAIGRPKNGFGSIRRSDTFVGRRTRFAQLSTMFSCDVGQKSPISWRSRKRTLHIPHDAKRSHTKLANVPLMFYICSITEFRGLPACPTNLNFPDCSPLIRGRFRRTITLTAAFCLQRLSRCSMPRYLPRKAVCHCHKGSARIGSLCRHGSTAINQNLSRGVFPIIRRPNRWLLPNGSQGSSGAIFHRNASATRR
jgi:hypothetical protein